MGIVFIILIIILLLLTRNIRIVQDYLECGTAF